MSDSSEKLGDLLPLSADHNAERLARLKQLFPDLFTNEGRLNVDELKKVADPALVSESERYDFRWYGKTAFKRGAFTPSRGALVHDAARSVNPVKASGNMIIEGENLEVLKLLTSAYRERVKCMYLDPPYNTGKDFVYSDRFAEGQRPYWEQTGVTEGRLQRTADARLQIERMQSMHKQQTGNQIVAPELVDHQPSCRSGFIDNLHDSLQAGALHLEQRLDQLVGLRSHIFVRDRVDGVD